MAADVSTSLKDWSTTAASNAPSGSTSISTNLDDNLRQMQATVRQLASSSTLAAATTTDLGSVDAAIITLTGGVATITGLGTVSAGIHKWVVMNAAHVLTHNATSLILPGGANITAAAGDTAFFVSSGSGNWRCLSYTKASGLQIAPASNFADGSAAAPAITFTSDTNTGIYRYGADEIGLTVAGTNISRFGLANTILAGTGTFSLAFASSSLSFGSAVSLSSLGTLAMASAARSGVDTGDVTISTGSISTGGAGGAGDILVTSGSVSSGSGNAGYISLTAGLATGGGSNGYISLAAGNDQTLKIFDTGLRVDVKRLYFNDTAGTPTITAGGGTGGTIAGSDVAGQITFGTGSPTSVTIDFTETKPTAPIVLVTGTQSGQVLHVSASTTQLQILSSTAFSSGTKVNYLAMQLE